MASVAGLFSTVGVSAIAPNSLAGDATISISGVFVASLVIERSVTNSMLSWEPITTMAGPGTLVIAGAPTSVFRVRCQSYTSGVVSYVLTPAAPAAASTAPAVTLAGISNKVLPVCRQRPFADGLNFIASGSSNNSANQRSIYSAPAGSALTDLVLKFPGSYQGNPEADLLLAYTVKASIEYPLGTTPTQVLFAGATSQVVTPGKVLYQSDACPVYIPAGARFAVKLYATWTTGVANLMLSSLGASGTVGEWFTVGVGVADNTLNNTTLSSSFTVGAAGRGVGLPCAVYGQLASAVPVIGFIGDSISQGVKDWVDPTFGGISIERALRGTLPIVNVARQSETFATYQSRIDGRNRLLVNNATHLLFFMGRNDVSASLTSAQIQTALKAAINPYLARGMKVYSATVTPISTSTDAWATVGNQTISNAGQDVNRVAYNAFLRSSYASVGLSGVFDFARIVDPNDTGLWMADGTAGLNSVGTPTMAGTGIASVALATYTGGTAYGGVGYPLSQSALACVVTRYPDDPIQSGDAVVTCATDGAGVVTSYTVVSPGTYGIPPMVCPSGPWTADGTHPTYRAYNAMMTGTGFSPAAFTLV